MTWHAESREMRQFHGVWRHAEHGAQNVVSHAGHGRSDASGG